MNNFYDSLLKIGYKSVDMPEKGVNVFYSGGKKGMNSFCFIDNDIINAPGTEHYRFIKQKIEETFDNAGYEDYLLVLILIAKDINNARKTVSGIDNYWLINSDTKRLIIYDNQPQELNGMRAMLDNYLENYHLPENGTVVAKVSQARSYSGYKNKRSVGNYITMSNIIIAINVFVFLLALPGGDVTTAMYIEKLGGLTVDGIKAGEYYRFFNSMFLHFGGTHLIYNMLFIFAFGNTIEPFLGRLRLVIIYLGGGLGGNIVAYLYNAEHNNMAVTAGASGAAYALMGGLIALAILDARSRRFNNPVGLIVIAILFISEGFTPGSNVSNSAHIGGIVSGFLIAIVVILVGNMLEELKRNKKRSN